jgi:uncharacterized protein YceH (UPF0502 family)
MMPDDYFKKNVEMWEKFTSGYMDMMFKTVEKTIEQSQSVKEQLDKIVGQTVSGQLETTVAALEALQRQVAALTERVDQLLEKEKVA